MKIEMRLKRWQKILFVILIIIFGAILLAFRLQTGVEIPLFPK